MNKSQQKLLENFSKAAQAMSSEIPKMIKGLEKNMPKESIEMVRKAMETTNLNGLLKDLDVEQKDFKKEYDKFIKENGGKVK